MERIKTRFKQLGDVLIDIYFQDNSSVDISKYKNFKLEIIQKEYASRLGCYNMKTKVIQLSGIKSYCRRDIIITFIHELSHHIEFVLCKTSGHQKTFYDIHIKLLKIAIDLGVLKTGDITNNKSSNASNKNKLSKMMSGYIGKGNRKLSDFMNTDFLKIMPEIIESKKTIKVKSLPDDKMIFKTNHYKWNPTELVWEKTTNNIEEYNDEVSFLSKNGFYNIKIDKKIYFAKYIKICISGNTYENKESISTLGYRYKNGIWLKYVTIHQTGVEIAKLRKIKGIKVRYEF